MNKISYLLLTICLPLFGTPQILEVNISHRFSPAFLDKYAINLQGPEVDLNFIVKNRFLLGGGIGPILMNGYCNSNQNIAAVFNLGFPLVINYDIFEKINKFNTFICIGGKTWFYKDRYEIVYDSMSNFMTLNGGYFIEDQYFQSLGIKLYSGLRKIRIKFSFYTNFGIRKENLLPVMMDYTNFYEVNHGSFKSKRFLTSYDLSLGICYLFQNKEN